MPALPNHLVVLLTMVVLVADAAGAVEPPRRGFAHEARIVYDLTRLDLGAVAAEDGQNWGVFHVRFGPVAEGEGERLQATYRRVGRAAVPVVVTLTAVDGLSGMLPKEPVAGVIEKEPNAMLRAGPVQDHFLDGFGRPVEGFTAVGRLTAAVPGVGPPLLLTDLAILPADWANQVKPALAGWRADRAIFADPKASSAADRLRALSRGKNLVLAAQAYRALAAAGVLGPDDLADADADDTVQSAAVLCLLWSADARKVDLRPQGADAAPEIDNLADELGRRFIDPSKSTRELHPLAVACALVIDTRRMREASTTAAMRLSKRITTRMAELQGADAKPDAYLVEALSPMRRTQRLLDLMNRKSGN